MKFLAKELPRSLPQLAIAFQNLKQFGCLANFAEFNAEGLHFNENFFHVNNFVSDETLQENTDESYQPTLHIFVFNCLACRNAVGDVQVNKL